MIRERTGRLESVQSIPAEDWSANYGFWERIPGILSWIVLLSPVWVTLISPPVGVMLIGIMTIYFAIRASLYGPRALMTRVRILKEGSEDWLGHLKKLEPRVDWRNDGLIDWRAVRVTLMIRAYRERNIEMLRNTLESIAASNWSRQGMKLQNLEVLFATEEDDPLTPPLVEQLSREFRDRLTVRQIRHPEEPGTLPGPSTAMHYAGQALYREAVSNRIDPRLWIVADFDADTLFHPQYVACLVHHYVTDPGRDFRAYQPVVLFTTDFWNAPLHSRLSALGTSVLTLGWNRKPEIAFTGAAASLSSLHAVDFWPTNSHSQEFRRGGPVANAPGQAIQGEGPTHSPQGISRNDHGPADNLEREDRGLLDQCEGPVPPERKVERGATGRVSGGYVEGSAAGSTPETVERPRAGHAHVPAWLRAPDRDGDGRSHADRGQRGVPEVRAGDSPDRGYPAGAGSLLDDTGNSGVRPRCRQEEAHRRANAFLARVQLLRADLHVRRWNKDVHPVLAWTAAARAFHADAEMSGWNR